MKNLSTSIPAYPLAWPVSNPRTKSFDRKRSSFVPGSWNRCIAELRLELKRLHAANIVISTNQPVRRDGEPFAQERRIDDPGVAVYFTVEGVQVCLPCDRWLTIAENMRAITKHIFNMRAQERYGVGTSKQAFSGYKALQAENQVSTEEDWWQVLECDRNAHPGVIAMQHKQLARVAHPDRPGGSDAAMQRLNTARDRAFAEKQVQQ